jgi:hypothetical protein
MRVIIKRICEPLLLGSPVPRLQHFRFSLLSIEVKRILNKVRKWLGLSGVLWRVLRPTYLYAHGLGLFEHGLGLFEHAHYLFLWIP